MAIAWPLIVVIAVMSLLILIGALYILVYYMHPEDRNAAHAPKVIVVLGLALACYNVLILPLDVGNRNTGNTIDMTLLSYILFWATAGMIAFVIPFFIFYYEAEEAENDNVRVRIYYAVCYSIAFAVVLILIIGLMYNFLGTAQIPVNTIRSRWQPASDPVEMMCSASLNCTQWATTLDIQVTLVVYTTAMLGFFGLILFIFYAGVGLMAMPMDFIADFKHRFHRLDTEDFNKMRKEYNVEANRLIVKGKKLQESMAKATDKGEKRRNKKAFNIIKREVYVLEKKIDKLKNIMKRRKSPLVFWLEFYAGCLCVILTTVWLIHIFVYMLYRPYLSGFLNVMFTALDNVFPLFGTIAYCLFAFYLLLAVIKGSIRLGMRFCLCISIHPMKLGETMMNSLLFNTGLVLLCSTYVQQFCVSAFSSYARLTATSAIFDLQINNLVGIKYVFRYCIFVLFGVVFLSGCFLYFCPAAPPREDVDDDD